MGGEKKITLATAEYQKKTIKIGTVERNLTVYDPERGTGRSNCTLSLPPNCRAMWGMNSDGFQALVGAQVADVAPLPKVKYCAPR
jgi:hypothetical protein